LLIKSVLVYFIVSKRVLDTFRYIYYI
jgi:hypothetical protein